MRLVYSLQDSYFRFESESSAMRRTRVPSAVIIHLKRFSILQSTLGVSLLAESVRLWRVMAESPSAFSLLGDALLVAFISEGGTFGCLIWCFA